MRTLMTVIAATLLAGPLSAQGWIEPLPGGPTGVVKLRTAVTARVSGRVALVQVEEWFENRGGGLGEGDYLYPLPGEAVFSNFSLFQGDQELRGETMDADRARAIYEEIVRRKRDPALIELVGHGLIRARVFPINPGETRKVTLRYTQVLERAGDALQFRYAAGARTEPAAPLVEGGRRPVTRPVDVPVSFRLVADSGDLFAEPFSPTHDLRVTRDEGGRLTVRTERELTGDLALFLPFAREMVGITLATHRPAGEAGYFMLTLSPGRADASRLPRDITAVVDISGSMSGEKLEQAKAALRQLLTTLDGRDRFRLVAFSNRVRAHRSDWSSATRDNLRDAEGWIDRLDANGGTNIEGALAEAFRVESREGRIPMVLFLTDGLPSVGENNPERLASQAERQRRGTRVFAFGVGYDVNTYLLDRLSDAGRGATHYVRPGEDVEDVVGQLVTKIQHPVLAELEIAQSPVEFDEVYPERLPDLFAGEELVVFGRYRAAPRDRTGRVVVTGRRNNRTERFGAEVSFPVHTEANDYIPRLWAARKLGYLTQTVRLNGPNEELIEEIRQTALRYGLLSEYTSYLVQEPTEVAVRDAAQRQGRAIARRFSLPSAAPLLPAQAVGEGAVNAAEQARAKREVKSRVDLEEADAREALMIAHGPAVSRVAGRLFIEDSGVWTDMTRGDSLEVVKVRQYSDAYFRLLERLPELEPYLKQFERVQVAGAEVAIRIGDDGLERLTPLQLARLASRFRGQ